MVFAFVPPAVTELGQANGFDFQLQDRGGLGHERLTEARNQLLGMAMKNPTLVAVRPNGQDDTPSSGRHRRRARRRARRSRRRMPTT